jgi:hypothetical protein
VYERKTVVAWNLAIVAPVVLDTFAVLAAVLYRPLALRITILGIWRNSFYVTNSHFYPEGFMKLFKYAGYQSLALWTDLVHRNVSDLKSDDDTGSVTGTVAIKGVHNNNGLGWGRMIARSWSLIHQLVF